MNWNKTCFPNASFACFIKCSINNLCDLLITFFLLVVLLFFHQITLLPVLSVCLHADWSPGAAAWLWLDLWRAEGVSPECRSRLTSRQRECLTDWLNCLPACQTGGREEKRREEGEKTDKKRKEALSGTPWDVRAEIGPLSLLPASLPSSSLLTWLRGDKR